MDVLLVDDKPGERALLSHEWAGHGLRVLHSDDLSEVDALLRGEEPVGWPAPPHRIVAAVIDLDLGHKGPGPAGGIVAADRLRRWMRASGRMVPLALRTADVDDDRSLAAVLAAELLHTPLPLWGKSVDDAARMRAWLVARSRGPAPATDFGALLVHPVRFVREERGERLLGDFLYDGPRADVWERLHEGFEPEAAVLASGFALRHKFWEPVNPLISAVVHLRDNGVALHQLGGSTLRLSDVEREMDLETVRDLEIAMYSVRQLPDTDDATAQRLLAELERTRQEHLDWLDGRGRRPSRNRNVDQGEFLGAFGRVLGHPDVVTLFRH